MAEIDRPGLARRLAELAASPRAHLRCVALYGLMKHYGYEGPYDPFESPQNSDAAIQGLRAHVATVAGIDAVGEPD